MIPCCYEFLRGKSSFGLMEFVPCSVPWLLHMLYIIFRGIVFRLAGLDRVRREGQLFAMLF